MAGLNIEPVPFLWVEDGKEDAYTPRTRKYNKRKKEMLGWASRQLVHFLKSLGKETNKAIPQSEIAELIGKYITENKLIHPEKRKRVICDERLYALFGRKTIGRVKIYDLLEAHIAENQEDSDDDLLTSSDDESSVKRQRVLTQERKTLYKKAVPQVPKTSLVAISSENIKLVYLKRTLVQELLKDPDTFEVKVSGGFVRVKTDPLDIFQKNSHQLEIVKGVKVLAQAGDNSSCTRLLISGLTNEISISEISDDNFSEEECEDLHKRMKDGLIKQPTVGELEEKVKILHEDITRHWLAKELALLKNLFDRANEKGWRPRAAEYLDKKKLLETPAEQERLLSEIPQVKAEEEKTEIVPEDPPDNVSYNDEDSPKAADWDWELSYDSPAKGIMTTASTEEAIEVEFATESRSNGVAQHFSEEERAPPKAEPTRSESNGHVISFNKNETHIPDIKPYGHVISFEHKDKNVISFEQKERRISETQRVLPEINGNAKSLNMPCQQNFSLTIKTKKNADSPLQQQISIKQDHVLKVENVQSKQIQVIDLSDDDDDDNEDEKHEAPINRKQIPIPSPRPRPNPSPNPSPRLNPRPVPGANPSAVPLLEQLMWHYYDPQRSIQGPFSLLSLKRWRDANFFPADFRVWRTGQNPFDAVLLNDLISQIFSN